MNIRKSSVSAALIMALAVLALLPFTGSAFAGESYGVYQYVVRKAEGTIDEISATITEAAVNSGWTVSGTTDSGDPDKCDFRSRVLVLFNPQYADEMVGANTETGPYAALDRVNIFQDEEGTHVSVVNPNSIDRTVLMDDTRYADISEKHLQELRAMILSAVKGNPSTAQYGQFRTEGKIGKTMGIVAGGDFNKLIHQKFKLENGDMTAVSEAIARAFQEKTRTWGLKLVYRVDMPARDVCILGISGSPMDTKSFQIVGSGQDKTREGFKCPGLSHAAAYPIEIVIYKDAKGVIRVAMIDVMYRMKMYFEDAGTTAFMKNMKMPGSIEKEIEKTIKKGLEQ